MAIVAAGITLGAMSVSIWQAAEARGARKTARDQADTARAALAETTRQTELAQQAAAEARIANELTERQHQREDDAQAAAALAHARKVTSQLTGSGGYAIEVTNDATEPFFGIELDELKRSDHPNWGLRLNPNVPGNRSRHDKLDGFGGTCKFYVEFVDDDGTAQRFDMGGGPDVDFDWTISYSDSHARRWHRTVDKDPVFDEGQGA
ncbi:hypothetical protein [Amycolatopsis pigmentata]|uniref:Uncharacterized protein n=1 Tax=Amycolatopsis pigmentata TaxID=450801 RepID=A0ABW5FIV4_9PSEU